MKKNQRLFLFTVVLFLFSLSCASKPLPDNGVTILSPKANDVVKAGESYEVLWKAEPAESEFGTMVTVEFSKDGGNPGRRWKKMSPIVGDIYGKFPK
jgi:hypothetical protein